MPAKPNGKEEITLEKQGVHLLMSEISTETTAPTVEWILKNSMLEDPFSILTLYINSPGGEIAAAFGLIDVMKGSPTPIRTIGIGEVCSAGLLIFIAGEKGERILTPNTSILSHQFNWGFWGKEHELQASQRGVELTSEMILTHYKKCTGLTQKKIKELHSNFVTPGKEEIINNEIKRKRYFSN